jgi:hypothetical protein
VNELQVEISSMHQEMGQIQNKVKIQEKLCAGKAVKVVIFLLLLYVKSSKFRFILNLHR